MVYEKDVYILECIYTLVCLKCVVQLYYILEYGLTESHKVRNDGSLLKKECAGCCMMVKCKSR